MSGPVTTDDEAPARGEITAAHRDWTDGHERYGDVASPLDRLVPHPPPWARG